MLVYPKNEKPIYVRKISEKMWVNENHFIQLKVKRYYNLPTVEPLPFVAHNSVSAMKSMMKLSDW